MALFNFVAPIPNTHNAIVRPVIHTVLKQLMCDNMLPTIKRVNYNDAIKRNKLNGTTLCNKAAQMKCEEYINIQAVPAYRTDNDHWGRTWARHRMPIWVDKAHELYVTPQYDEMAVTLTIQVVTTSLSKLRQWSDQVRMMQRRGRQRVNHPVEYAMPFPRIAFQWFCDMYDLTDDNDSLTAMIEEHGSNALDVISSGTHLEFVTSEHQINAKGTMLETSPSIEKLINGSYTGTMEYLLEYNKPIAMLFEYPIMVHQTTIPTKYLPEPPCIPSRYWVEDPMRNIDLIEDTRPVEALHVPNFDREIIDSYPPWYAPVLTVLVSIDPENPLELFNLNQLGDVYVDQQIRDVIQKFYLEEITQHRRAPFLLTLHRDNDPLHHSYLSINDELDITLTEPITNDGIYRVSLCILTNAGAVPFSAFRGLATNKAALTNYVKVVNSMPISAGAHLGSASHGLNAHILVSDFDHGHHLKAWSPLVCIGSEDVPRNVCDGYSYTKETKYARGTAGGHIREQTVESLSVSAGASGNISERSPKNACSGETAVTDDGRDHKLGNFIAKPKPNGDD